MESVLNQLGQDDYTVLDEDVPRLSPLIHEHINIYCSTAPRTPKNPAINLYYQSFSEV